MLKAIRNKLTQAVLGDPVRDWGVVYEQQGRFFTEQINLGLYRKQRELSLWLRYAYKSRISYNTYGFQIPVYNLHNFVTVMQSRYAKLCSLANRARPVSATASDRLPFFHRLMLRVIHGIRASLLLMDYTNPATHATEYRFYGYVSRNSAKKIFIQSDLDISRSSGHVISGEGLEAALAVLADAIESGALD